MACLKANNNLAVKAAKVEKRETIGAVAREQTEAKQASICGMAQQSLPVT